MPGTGPYWFHCAWHAPKHSPRKSPANTNVEEGRESATKSYDYRVEATDPDRVRASEAHIVQTHDGEHLASTLIARAPIRCHLFVPLPQQREHAPVAITKKSPLLGSL